MNRSAPGLHVHHQLLESTQTHVHCVGDAIQPSHPLSSPPALSLSQHQGLFKWVSSPHQVAKVLGPDAMIFVFWMMCFKPTFSLPSFTFVKRLFSSSSLSAIRVVSSAYLRLLIFLPAERNISPAFLLMYSAYKLNKQGDNIQPWRTPFPIWNQSVVPCSVLTVASWICIQISQEAG